MKRTGLKTAGRSVLRNLLARKGLFEGEMFSVYPYMHDPDQLMFLAQSLADVRDVPGCCLEVGCARGATTVYLNKWMALRGIAKRYVAIDTFGGFPEEQSAYEIEKRGKSATIKYAFAENDPAWVDRSLRMSGVSDVELVRGDAAKVDYAPFAPIAWCLLDVDLYLPIAAALPKIYAALSPGGVIVVDDCMEDERWDGALQAYMEYVTANAMPVDIAARKLGMIRKPL